MRKLRLKTHKITTFVIPILLLNLLAACGAPAATPTPLPLTATPTPLPSTATPTPLPPTATPAPVEVIASQVEDLVGIWEIRYLGDRAYMQYKADGTFNLAYTVADLESNPAVTGRFWFEGTVFNVDDSCGKGTYEVRVQKEGDKPIRLIFSAINDPCTQRAQDMRAKLRWVEP